MATSSWKGLSKRGTGLSQIRTKALHKWELYEEINGRMEKNGKNVSRE